MAPEDIQEVSRYLGIKEVDSGADMFIFPLENDSYIKDCKIVNGTWWCRYIIMEKDRKTGPKSLCIPLISKHFHPEGEEALLQSVQ